MLAFTNLYLLFAVHCVGITGVLRVTRVFLVGLSYFFIFAINQKEKKRAFILVENVCVDEIKIKHGTMMKIFVSI